MNGGGSSPTGGSNTSGGESSGQGGTDAGGGTSSGTANNGGGGNPNGGSGGGNPNGGSGGGNPNGGDGGSSGGAGDFAHSFGEAFDTWSTSLWSCEYTCPQVSGGFAQFLLQAGVAPNNQGSWSKIRYKPRRFTSGRFTARFSLSQRPEQAVWWGIALWDDGPSADGSQFNEINFGYTTDESFPNTQLRFESAKHGKDVSLKVDTGVDLYDGSYHTGTLEYDSTHVSFYFDGQLLKTITDQSVIPTDPVDFIVGPRLVTSPALGADFTESVDAVQIEW